MTPPQPITNAHLASATSELSAAARQADMVEYRLVVVEAAPFDPYADRQQQHAPEVEVTVKRRCCTIIVRDRLGASVWGQRFACAHQRGG